MIEAMLEAAERALSGGDHERTAWCPDFIEEWVPKVANEFADLQKKYDDLLRLYSMTEAQLLEAEAKIKELEDV